MASCCFSCARSHWYETYFEGKRGGVCAHLAGSTWQRPALWHVLCGGALSWSEPEQS